MSLDYPELQWPLPCFVQSRTTGNIYWVTRLNIQYSQVRPLCFQGYIVQYGPRQEVCFFSKRPKKPCPQKCHGAIESGRFFPITPTKAHRHSVILAKLEGVIHG